MESQSIKIPRRQRGRPPKDGREHAETKRRLIRAGVEVLTEKGFSAVGLEGILHRAGLPKGSFYYYFGSKEAFGSALISAYADYFARKLDHWFLNEARTPLDRLRDFVADARSGMARYDYRRGCLVGNLGQEMGTLPESFRAQLVEVFQDWQDRTARCLRAAQLSGEIAPGRDCDRLAALFWIGWEGAVLRSKLERNPDALDYFAQGFIEFLQG